MGRSIQKQHNDALHRAGKETAAISLRAAIQASKLSAEKPSRALRLLRGAVQFPYTFVAMNGAAVIGLYAFLRDRKDIWVRTTDLEAWEAHPEPTVSLSTARSSNPIRKAA